MHVGVCNSSSREYIGNIDDSISFPKLSFKKKQACSLKRQRCNVDETLMISMQTLMIINVSTVLTSLIDTIDVSLMILQGNCRSTPARHAAKPYRQKRPPKAQKKLRHFITSTKLSLYLIMYFKCCARIRIRI